MINWPTAFVIAVALVCGAIIINKPSDAGFGGDNGVIKLAQDGVALWHLKDGELRFCYDKVLDDLTSPPNCSP